MSVDCEQSLFFHIERTRKERSVGWNYQMFVSTRGFLAVSKHSAKHEEYCCSFYLDTMITINSLRAFVSEIGNRRSLYEGYILLFIQDFLKW